MFVGGNCLTRCHSISLSGVVLTEAKLNYVYTQLHLTGCLPSLSLPPGGMANFHPTNVSSTNAHGAARLFPVLLRSPPPAKNPVHACCRLPSPQPTSDHLQSMHITLHMCSVYTIHVYMYVHYLLYKHVLSSHVPYVCVHVKTYVYVRMYAPLLPVKAVSPSLSLGQMHPGPGMGMPPPGGPGPPPEGMHRPPGPFGPPMGGGHMHRPPPMAPPHFGPPPHGNRPLLPPPRMPPGPDMPYHGPDMMYPGDEMPFPGQGRGRGRAARGEAGSHSWFGVCLYL